MAKQQGQPLNHPLTGMLGERPASVGWETQLSAVAARYNREYRRETIDLPDEVTAMPIYGEWVSGLLSSRIASPFWELAPIKKNQRVLDIGCGVSFLIYPWRDWEAYFYGQEISSVAQETLNSRGPQLNSKLFKGVKLGPAHNLSYEADQFDTVVATGISCYYPLDYWDAVMAQAKRVLKPGGVFVFDVLDPEPPLAENWAILETYLGAEVFLHDLADWQHLIKQSGATAIKTRPGELFQLYRVQLG
jgi:SAM-dependent methyltransferase